MAPFPGPPGGCTRAGTETVAMCDAVANCRRFSGPGAMQCMAEHIPLRGGREGVVLGRMHCERSGRTRASPAGEGTHGHVGTGSEQWHEQHSERHGAQGTARPQPSVVGRMWRWLGSRSDEGRAPSREPPKGRRQARRERDEVVLSIANTGWLRASGCREASLWTFAAACLLCRRVQLVC